MSPPRALEGKAALIIGASRGMGASTARAFVAQGARTVIASRDLTKLEALAEELRQAGGDVLAFQCDASDPRAVEATVEFAETSFGRLDVAFNNGAINPVRARFADHTLEDFEAVLDTNLRSVFVAMRAQIRAMLRSGGGSIINTSSSAGQVGMPNMAGYVASKHGVIGLTKAAALDHGRDNIRVNAIMPGAFMTQMLTEGSGGSAEGQQRIMQATPLGRIAHPDEVAGTVVWLASEQSSFVTGVSVPVDGGWVAQ